MKRSLLILAALLTLPAAIAAAQDAVTVSALAETEPSPGDGATAVVIWPNRADLTQSLIITTDDDYGIVTYDLDGAAVQSIETDSEVSNISLRENFSLDGASTALIAVGVADAPEIYFYTLDDARELVEIGRIETNTAHIGLCLYQSQITGTTYLFNLDEDGYVEQFALAGDGGEITATLARDFYVGSETEGCAADDELGNLFLGETGVALWQYDAEPESSNPRRLLDSANLGNITEELKGLALYTAADGEGYLIASDENGDRYLVYERGGDQAYVGTFAVGDGNGIDAVSEANAMTVVNVSLSDSLNEGLFVTADDSNDEGANNFKLVSWGDIARALDLTIDTAYSADSAEEVTGVTASGAVAVTATIETEPVNSTIDAADDPAIWIHPDFTLVSAIIGTDKSDNGGLVVYNLDGSIHQQVTIGNVNNVDIRYNFMLDGVPTTLVTATNRTNNSLVIYRANPVTRELEDVAARAIISEVEEVYGLCMYVSAESGLMYAILNSADTGEVEQYELFDDGNGMVDARLVRAFVVGSQTEGCAVDDYLGHLYVGEEAVGIWKYGAEPDAGDERTSVDTTDEDGYLTADVEGMAIYYADEETGYLIASSQGSSEFVVYEREGDNEYVGTFVISESAAVDGVTGSDGLDVTNFDFGEGFSNGFFVTQDDSNINPDANQNFKIVPWEAIAGALNLTSSNQFDPRTIGQDS